MLGRARGRGAWADRAPTLRLSHPPQDRARFLRHLTAIAIQGNWRDEMVEALAQQARQCHWIVVSPDERWPRMRMEGGRCTVQVEPASRSHNLYACEDLDDVWELDDDVFQEHRYAHDEEDEEEEWDEWERPHLDSV